MSAARLPDELAEHRSVVILAPHQDDEILGCGHLMRAYTRAKAALTVVWLTDGGSAFGPVSAAARAALTSRRANEALAGLRAMDIECEPIFLGYPDGSLAQPENSNPAAERLAAIVRERLPDALFVTDGEDGHPDHRAAFGIARQLCAPTLYSYPVSARYDGGEPDVGRDAIILDADSGEAKRRGLICHLSQREGGGALYPLTEATIDRFCASAEIFYRIRSKQP